MLPVRGAEHCNMKNSCSHSHRSHSSSVCQRYYQRHCFPRPVHRLSHDSLMYVSFANPEESCCSSWKTKTVEIANSRKRRDTVQIPYTHKTMMLLWSRITLQLVLRAAWKSSKEWVAASKNSFCRIDDLRRWPVQKIGNMIGEIRYLCDIDMSSDRHYLFSCFFRCIRSCAFPEMLHVTVLYVVSNREGWKVSLGYVRVRGVKTNIEKVKTLMY